MMDVALEDASISREQYLLASSVQRRVMLQSITISPNRSEPGWMHRAGKSAPKTGVRAYRMFQQNVAATALAASNGIQ
jgi:hypothetical protein